MTEYGLVISNPDVFLAALQQLDALLDADAGITVAIPEIVKIVALRSSESARAQTFLETHRTRIHIDETRLHDFIAEAEKGLESEIPFLRNSCFEYESINTQIRAPGRKLFIVSDDWLERNQVPADDRFYWIRISDFMAGMRP